MNNSYWLQCLQFELRYFFRDWLSQTQSSWGFLLLVLILTYTAYLYLPANQSITFQGLLILFLLMAGLLVFAWVKRLQKPMPLLIQATLLVLGLALGAGLSIIQWQKIEQKQLPATYQNQWVTVKGTLWPDEQGWQLSTAFINNQRVNANLGLGKKVHFSAEAIGSKMVVGGVLKLPANPRFSGDFDDWHYRLAKHQEGALLRPKIYRNYGNASLSWWEGLQAGVLASVHSIRERVAIIFKQTLGEESGSLLGGIVLGDRAIQLPAPTKEAFLKTGQIHLVAASGMNIAFVAGCMTLLLALLPQKPFRLVRFALISAGVGFYTLLTGLPPSIKRAATMWQLGLWVRGVNRGIHALNLLLLAVAFLCVLDGVCVFSVGFQLSVLTTLGIIAYTPKFENLGQRLRLPDWFNVAVMVTVVAQLWANPLILYYFHQIPLHATVFNAISSVLVAPLTMLGFIGTLGLSIHEGITQTCAWLATWGLQFMLLVTHWGAGFTNALFKLNEPLPIPLLLTSYGLLLAPIFGRLTQAHTLLPRPKTKALPVKNKLFSTRWIPVSAISCVVLPVVFLMAQPQLFQQPKPNSTIATATPATVGIPALANASATTESTLYFVPISASKPVYLWQPVGQHPQTMAILPAQFSDRDAQAVSAFLFQKKIAFPKTAFVLNAPPRTKRSAKSKQPKTNPMAGLVVAKQTWGLSTVYTADAVSLKRSLFSGKIISAPLGAKAPLNSSFFVKPQWCSHAKKERWQVCLLATQGKHVIWLGNMPATQKVAWQKPTNNLYQAISIKQSNIEIVE